MAHRQRLCAIFVMTDGVVMSGFLPEAQCAVEPSRLRATARGPIFNRGHLSDSLESQAMSARQTGFVNPDHPTPAMPQTAGAGPAEPHRCTRWLEKFKALGSENPPQEFPRREGNTYIAQGLA